MKPNARLNYLSVSGFVVGWLILALILSVDSAEVAMSYPRPPWWMTATVAVLPDGSVLEMIVSLTAFGLCLWNSCVLVTGPRIGLLIAYLVTCVAVGFIDYNRSWLVRHSFPHATGQLHAATDIIVGVVMISFLKAGTIAWRWLTA